MLDKEDLSAIALGGNHLIESLKIIEQENNEKYQDLR